MKIKSTELYGFWSDGSDQGRLEICPVCGRIGEMSVLVHKIGCVLNASYVNIEAIDENQI